MPKRNRTKEQRSIGGHAVQQALAGAPTAPIVETESSRAAKLFAQSIRDHAAADQADRDRKAAEIEHERRHADLLAARESAAAEIRRLRADGRPRQKMADADAAYRVALGELTEFETGERPHWAPAPADAIDEAGEATATGIDDGSEGSGPQPS